MKFIYVKLNGGLGNQLFQYATARGVMRKNDMLLLNLNSFDEDYLGRQFRLHNYKIGGAIIGSKKLKKIFIPNTKVNLFINKLGLYANIEERGFFVHKEIKSRLNLINYIQGFWQSEDYFKEIRLDLLNELVPREIPQLPPIFIQANTVAVHIRRTDYLTDNRYGFLGEEYYRSAIQIFKQKINNPVFIIFSDDYVWCKKVFGKEAILFCEDLNWQHDYLQLYLMSRCSHQIVANSSYSWWGAWLNVNPEKIIIRPKTPFKDLSLLYENHYPKSWIAI
jgi:hypothetical protein